jgi:hypothetical protein
MYRIGTVSWSCFNGASPTCCFNGVPGSLHSKTSHVSSRSYVRLPSRDGHHVFDRFACKQVGDHDRWGQRALGAAALAHESEARACCAKNSRLSYNGIMGILHTSWNKARI